MDYAFGNGTLEATMIKFKNDMLNHNNVLVNFGQVINLMIIFAKLL